MDTVTLLDELRILAKNGLEYTDDPYDRERYERILELTSEEYSELSGLPTEEVKERFATELGHVTPKLGADAAVFNDEGALLLMRRADGDQWCLPGGWVEPNESPAEAAVRETQEETGLQVSPVHLVDTYSIPADAETTPHGQVSVVYLCRVDGGTLSLSQEANELRYRRVPDVSEWFTTHEEFARDAAQAWQRRQTGNLG